MKVAFFGHDAGDAAVKRRVAAFERDGVDVVGLMMRRGDDAPRAWENIDLGQTFDAAYSQRMKAMLAGAKIASAEKEILASADIFYARNLDMLACAFMVRRLSKICRPVIYECLDIHTMMTGGNQKANLMRKAERALLKRSEALVVSSPGFVRDYFEPVHGEALGAEMPPVYLLENRLTDVGLPERPKLISPSKGPLRIGLFGILRCQRSINLLIALARQFGSDIEIILHGKPAEDQVVDLPSQIAQEPNVSFGGAYQSPEDLPGLYESVDLIWAGDYFQAGANSDWLLPNRLYEGGYFAVPPIVAENCETGRWVAQHQAGFTIEADIETSAPALIKKLLADRSPIAAYRQALINLPRSVFIEPEGELHKMLLGALKTDQAA